MRKTMISRFVPITAVGLVVGLGAFAHSVPAVAKTLSVALFGGSGDAFAYGTGIGLSGEVYCGTASVGTTNTTTCPDYTSGMRAYVYAGGALRCSSAPAAFSTSSTNCTWGGLTGAVWGDP
jgi:hypothetical protein